jgi:hypothetical protein
MLSTRVVMTSLEQLIPGASVRGLVAGAAAKVVQVEWFGDQAVKVTFEEPTGAVGNRLVYQITAVYGEMLPRQPFALPARRRSRRRQDHHGGPSGQGAADPGRPRALPRGRARQPGRAEEVLQHLTTLPHAGVRLTLEIEADAPTASRMMSKRVVTEKLPCPEEFTKHGFERG